jgi:putative ABC transport system permease protein
VRDTSHADLWVMDPQVEFTEDFKPMLDTALQRVRGVPGVLWAVPLYKNYLRCRLPDGTLLQMRIVGIDDGSLAGGPPEIVSGRLTDLRQDRAIFVNADDLNTKLAQTRPPGRPGMKVGDRLSVNDNEAVIVGTYRATKEFFWEPVAFTTYGRAMSWAPPERRMMSYVLVKATPGSDLNELAGRIEQRTGLAARTSPQFERQTMDSLLEKTGILINFGITIVLGFVIGLLVAGQTFYTFVLDNLRPFAALKAMGATDATVLRMLCLQVVTVGLVGYGVGLGTACLTGTLLSRGGGLAFQMHWTIPVLGAVGVLVCCLAAGAMGMVRVLRLEPAVVFKS